jgi:hypothetical protein
MALIILLWSAPLLHAQKVVSGTSSGGVRISGGHGTRTGPSHGVARPRAGVHRRNGFGTAWLPWYSPYWDDDDYFGEQYSDQRAVETTAPQVVVVEAKDSRPPAPPPEPPKLVEVTTSKDTPIAKRQPPTAFILTDGERLESRYYILTAKHLTIEVARQQRTVPISALDLDATIAANHEREIELTIPRDSSLVFMGF